jgi:release factor glutamine methyltransferase
MGYFFTYYSVKLENWQIRYISEKLGCRRDKLRENKEFEGICKRIVLGEPLSKIFQEKYFWKDCFFTNKYTLDPRPDSELLIQTIVDSYDKNSKLRILDLGTGTGALGLSLLREFPHWHATLLDYSEQALIVAKKNAISLGLMQRCKFIRNNWLQGIDEKFDLVISNPPYILKTEKINQGATFDPEMSLFCPNVLHFYKPIATKIHNFKAVFLEINPKYLEKYINLFGEKTTVLKDLSGKARVIIPEK